jgi:hypothetical protein
MKIGFTQSLHVCLAAAVLVAVGVFTPASAAPAPADHKSVDVSVTVVGDIDDVDEGEVEALAEHLLEAGHIAVTDDDGPDVIELHITIALDDDGHGFAIHFEAGAWKQDADINEISELEHVVQVEVTEFEETIDDDE